MKLSEISQINFATADPESIDVERAKSAQKRAEERIAAYNSSSKDSTIDIKRAEAALARAKARLLVKNIQS